MKNLSSLRQFLSSLLSRPLLLCLPQWTTTDPVNPAAGLISGCLLLLMGLLSWSPIRRASYELFLVGHSLWPLVLLFGFLHTEHSETKALYPFAPGFVLLMLDLLCVLCDGALRPTRMLDW